ncbi:MAG TPA: glucuronate isomerase [Blastocatellia bacterium]|nr:glucuronate isomerase [Blastocatellia bacterium]
MTTMETGDSAVAPLLTDRAELRRQVEMAVNTTSVVDVHTHIFPPEFGGMSLYGIDELLTYHYLIAETFRSSGVAHERFWQMTKTEQADLVWQTLFVKNSPLSEATRGIVTALNAFGLDTRAPSLREARDFFSSRKLDEHLGVVLKMARVSDVVMTNDPFSEQEANIWNGGANLHAAFHASLRMDGLLNDWTNAVDRLASQGFVVDRRLTDATSAEVRRFLDKWIERMKPVYMAVSLPAGFKFPDNDERDWLLREVVFPTAREHGLAFTVMVGPRRGVNPALRSAGDGSGRADVTAVERMCLENPDIRFLATFLSLENQHELCVTSRKFNNLMPFGCWWFLNNPSLVSAITCQRLELLGPSFIPQHSDARVLEQLVYKWEHARSQIAHSLYDAYERFLGSGRAVTGEEIKRDVERLFSGNFRDWVGLTPGGRGQATT